MMIATYGTAVCMDWIEDDKLLSFYVFVISMWGMVTRFKFW